MSLEGFVNMRIAQVVSYMVLFTNFNQRAQKKVRSVALSLEAETIRLF